MQLYLFSEQETKDPKIPGSEDYQELVWCDDMNIDILYLDIWSELGCARVPDINQIIVALAAGGG